MTLKDISSFSEWIPLEKKIQQGRWQISLINGDKKIWVPNAHFVWLVGNPAFRGIPSDYVIHHLDGDKLNDDISNLALIQKNYHLSYHAKNIPTTTPVKLIDLQNSSTPNKKPRAMKGKKSRSWKLLFYADHKDQIVSRYDGKLFKINDTQEIEK